jgi:DNA-binding NtrC family response regulator
MRRSVIGISDDDAGLQQRLHARLLAEGNETVGWNRGAGAYAFLRMVQPELVILDLWLEHPDAGSMVLGLLMIDSATQHVPVIICSAYR